MVCAPSNAALDQIMLRILEKGLIGLQGLKRPKAELADKNGKRGAAGDEDEHYEPPDLSKSLIRITSAEYTTDTVIKRHTLEQRIIKRLSIEKFGDLKRAIKEVKDLLNQMADFDSWDEYQDFPYVNKVKYKSYVKRCREGFLRMVDGFGDVGMTRQQQQASL